MLTTDAKAVLDCGIVPSTGDLVLATVCRLPPAGPPRTDLAKLARKTFGFLAKTAGGDKMVSKMKAEDAATRINWALVGFDADKGAFAETIDVVGVGCEGHDLVHAGVLTPDCEVFCGASHKRVTMWGLSYPAHEDGKGARARGGPDEVAITILPGVGGDGGAPAGGEGSGDGRSDARSDGRSVDDSTRASSDISEDDLAAKVDTHTHTHTHTLTCQ